MRMTPSGLSDEEIEEGNKVAEKAVHALKLRSVTAHVELMKLAQGWKVIELGSRIGGYRHDIYKLSYGINHIMNDINNRAGEVPEIPTKLLAYTAVFNIYAREEGTLTHIEGVNEVKNLASFVSMKQSLHEGQSVLFAKHNGDPVFEIILSNTNKDQFDKDVSKMQDSLVLAVEGSSSAQNT